MKSSADACQGPSRPLIVLLSDFGADSFYVGAMKAAVLAVTPNTTLVDLTHSIRPYAIAEASFVLARVFDLFTPGSIFLAVVDPGVGSDRKNLMLKSADRYIVAPDNGLVSDIDASFGIDSAFAIDEDAVRKIRRHTAVGRTFLGRDVFAPAAGYLAGGGPVAQLGRSVEDYVTIEIPPVEVGQGLVRGTARFVDAFGNVISNITHAHVKQAFGGVPLEKIHGTVNNTIGIDGISEFFSQCERGDLMLILDSFGLVELSVNQGRAIDRFRSEPRIEIELSLTPGIRGRP